MSPSPSLSKPFLISFTNVAALNRIYYSHMEVARGNQLNVSVRYEKRKWEAAAGFTLFEYTDPGFGINFRYGALIIGTDRLLEWLSVTDIRSFDFFVGFKTNICGNKTRQKEYCPSFN